MYNLFIYVITLPILNIFQIKLYRGYYILSVKIIGTSLQSTFYIIWILRTEFTNKRGYRGPSLHLPCEIMFVFKLNYFYFLYARTIDVASLSILKYALPGTYYKDPSAQFHSVCAFTHNLAHTSLYTLVYHCGKLDEE